jgi:hypothetical protein
VTEYKNLTRTGLGRPKGVPNKSNAMLKDMILQALDMAGGPKYLHEQAQKNPGPFMALIGKVLPLQITGANNGPVMVITGVARPDDEQIDPDPPKRQIFP